MRVLILVTMLWSVMLISVSAAIDWSPILIWNASASVPMGLYHLHPGDHLEVADLVVVVPPEPVARFLAERDYLPRGVPLLKQVLGLPGQIVCRIRLLITIDGVVMATARERDHRGRPLPVWQGCQMIAEGDVFVMNWQSADSLDGRYFGPVPAPRSCGSTLDLRGAVTMPIFRWRPSVSLFIHEQLHSCVLCKTQPFDGRNYGLGGPLRRNPSVSPWKERLTAAGLPRVGTSACLIATIVLGCLSCSIVVAAGKSTLNGAATTHNRWASYVAEASQRFGVPAHWIRAVMQLESTHDKGAVSPKGAMGLMKVMPETYAELRLRYHLGTDPYEPRNNILAGAAYLRQMLDRFGPDGFLAAYNAGPGRYEGYLKSGRPLPEETRNYVATLAPVIGVPGVPHHSDRTSTASSLTISGAAHDGGEHLRAPSKSKLNLGISQFDERQNARTMTLFAIVQAVFEPTSASTQTIDMTALAPAPSHALITTSAAAESLRIRTSAAPRSSLAPSGNALFAGRSTHTSK